MREINFDGIVGPSHNFSGLSLGNLAATQNRGSLAHPRAAALEGLAKMRANLDLGLVQGIFLPHDRPNEAWLKTLATSMEHAAPALRANALSASAMWAANAATVSPAPDTTDGRCHLTVANLVTMPHRSHEWPQTLAQLRLAFADARYFAVHEPVPAPFGDEGAANHMRLASRHDAPAIEVFVYGSPGGPFPARAVSLADALQTYLFNAQLVSLPEGGMALILPIETRDHPGVWSWLSQMVNGNGPIQRLIPVDVRQSMRNGGGPACLRLRVVADPATVDPRFLVDLQTLDRIASVIAQHWPEQIAVADLGDPALWQAIKAARAALLAELQLEELS